MTSSKATESGFASIGDVRLYYETAGAGRPLVMIHAGVGRLRRRLPSRGGGWGQNAFSPIPLLNHPLPRTQMAVEGVGPRARLRPSLIAT